jgi:chromosome partitioning protein
VKTPAAFTSSLTPLAATHTYRGTPGSRCTIPRRVAFINEKGGSGKTTLVANVASYLAMKRGRRTLAIDMDPQGQLGKVLGLEVRKPRGSAIELLVDSLLGDASRPEALDSGAIRRGLPISTSRIPNLDVIVANKSLALFPGWTGPDGGGAERRLAHNLEQSGELDNYDFVLFDAPPSFGPLTLSVLLASEEVAVPVPLTYLALDGFAELLRTIRMVQTRYDHPKLRISMVIPTFYRRTRLAHEILDKLTQRFPKEIAQTVLGFHVKVDEAQSHGLSIFEYAPSDRGAKAMAAIAEELEARERPRPSTEPLPERGATA